MARLKNGILGHITGRVGDMIYYMLNGKLVARNISKISTVPPSELQLASRARFAIANSFTKSVKNFVKVSFGEAKGPGQNAYNKAISTVLLNALSGEYPEYTLDYSKVILSLGSLQPARESSAELENGEVVFTWLSNNKWPVAADRVMMIAYCEELEEVVYSVGGQKRIVGRDVLNIPQEWSGQRVHLYISFCSEDQKKVANSEYLGNLII